MMEKMMHIDDTIYDLTLSGQQGYDSLSLSSSSEMGESMGVGLTTYDLTLTKKFTDTDLPTLEVTAGAEDNGLTVCDLALMPN
ncbi:hypothetical protein SAMN05216302_102048 [Nitrosomonas aestuarii]|uniref:Uncharacterized protein n=1 Tax=Nitrosomonas aestuarii TaxID=52441 RepID=A0A1I4DGG6_9PROT|nr:hypothetical protein [Nitrosomonas aestuarii]SFK90971.1 hypothetical protein SAMN05216302_102048 [Nitrosomonas aestuarii]